MKGYTKCRNRRYPWFNHLYADLEINNSQSPSESLLGYIPSCCGMFLLINLSKDNNPSLETEFQSAFLVVRNAGSSVEILQSLGSRGGANQVNRAGGERAMCEGRGGFTLATKRRLSPARSCIELPAASGSQRLCRPTENENIQPLLEPLPYNSLTCEMWNMKCQWTEAITLWWHFTLVFHIPTDFSEGTH